MESMYPFLPFSSNILCQENLKHMQEEATHVNYKINNLKENKLSEKIINDPLIPNFFILGRINTLKASIR